MQRRRPPAFTPHVRHTLPAAPRQCMHATVASLKEPSTQLPDKLRHPPVLGGLPRRVVIQQLLERAAQLGGAHAQHKGDGIHDVGLAGAVGADDGGEGPAAAAKRGAVCVQGQRGAQGGKATQAAALAAAASAAAGGGPASLEGPDHIVAAVALEAGDLQPQNTAPVRLRHRSGLGAAPLVAVALPMTCVAI